MSFSETFALANEAKNGFYSLRYCIQTKWQERRKQTNKQTAHSQQRYDFVAMVFIRRVVVEQKKRMFP
jgi:hypothetical protein